MSHAKSNLWGWYAALYVLVCLPMLLLPINCVRDAYFDVQMIHHAALRTEISRLRSQAARRASQLEVVMGWQEGGPEFGTLRENQRLQAEWKKLGSPSGHDLYAAVVDPMGTIVLHSDASLIGGQLGRGWYANTVPEAGNDVVRTDGGALSQSKSAFDVRVPLIVDGRDVGDYHEGLDADWFDRHTATLQRDALRSWLWVFVLVMAVDLAGALALYRIAMGQRKLAANAQHSEHERATQLGHIASGLAHEIRNPLHALRLNLHALGKVVSGRTQLSQDELLATIQESDAEIYELEGLLRDLIRFASPDASQKVEVNVVNEVQATLNLLQEDMRQKDIEVHSHWPERSVVVWFDPTRLRQMLVNLLTFAQNNAGCKGRIDVHVNRSGSHAEVIVADNGPAMSQSQVDRIFEPFAAPRGTGSGLGLALVETFAKEAGGSASCELNGSRGNRFRVLLPDSIPRR